MWTWNSFVLGPIYTGVTRMGTPSVERNVAPTLINSFGSSLEIPWGISTGKYFRTTSNISTMIFQSPSGYKFSSTMRVSLRCTISINIYFRLQIGGMSMINLIGPPAKDNYLRVRCVLQLETTLQHPCRMKWTIKTRTIYPYSTNNGVTFCPPWRQKII